MSRHGERTLLVATPISPALVAAIERRLPVAGPPPAPFAQSVAALDASLRERVVGCVTVGAAAFPASAMDALPRLRWIGCYGSGFEGIDLAAAGARGIAVTHSPGANADSVADLAVGLMIASVRGLRAARQRLDSGEWQGNAAQRTVPVRGLGGRRLGVFGLGEIGVRIARRAEAFGMTIGYHNRRPRPGVDYAYFPTLLELARWADTLAVAVRADAATRHAVDGAVLEALGPDGHVVNIARGFVIDEAALVTALERRIIAGAGLDVFEHEPEIPAALRALPNAVLTPHVGGATEQAREAMENMVLANLDAFLAGAPLPNRVPLAAAAAR